MLLDANLGYHIMIDLNLCMFFRPSNSRHHGSAVKSLRRHVPLLSLATSPYTITTPVGGDTWDPQTTRIVGDEPTCSDGQIRGHHTLVPQPRGVEWLGDQTKFCVLSSSQNYQLQFQGFHQECWIFIGL